MNKYTIVGFLNLLLGVFQITTLSFFLIFTLPRITQIYFEFSTSPSLTTVYLVPGINLVLGGANLFLGFKLFSQSSQTREKYFKYALIFLLGSLLLPGALLFLGNLSFVTSIYRLTSQL